MSRPAEVSDYEKHVRYTNMRRALHETRDFLTMLLESRPKQVNSLLKHSGEELEARLTVLLNE